MSRCAIRLPDRGPAVAGHDDAAVEGGRDDRGRVGQVQADPLARRAVLPPGPPGGPVPGSRPGARGGEEVGEGRRAGSHARSREPFTEVVEPHGDPSGW